jgi:hypothetical protein
VARTLEQDWETALAEQTRLEVEYERFRGAPAAAPSAAELAAIQALAQDVPVLGQAETTTREERQTIVRLLLERVLVTVIDGSKQVHVECHWQGGQRTVHTLTRPVARRKALSTYADLVARASALHRDGQDCVAIAATLNQEGWRPAKRCTTFNAAMVRHRLLDAGVIRPRYHRRKPQIDRHPDEWTIRELAAGIGMPEPTLYTWVQRGRLRSRLVRTGPGMTKLVYADSKTIAALRAARAIPAPWHRLPSPPLPQPHH